MAEISQDEAYARFLHFGRNSSHFVWFLAGLKFHECANGCIFAYARVRDVTIFALDPLIPRPFGGDAFPREELLAAWREVKEALQPKISLFVSVQEEFFRVLVDDGFQAIQIGREPFVKLEDCIPTGSKGKGVRAARNQALRSGIAVEEWNAEKLAQNPAVVAEMRVVMEDWRARNVFELGGFLNTVDPFTHMDMRRYFLARKNGGRLEGFLVATPIPGRNSHFLEDLVLRRGVARGTGELLTLEAMTALAESRGELASLGVVSMVGMDEAASHGLSSGWKRALVTLPKLLSKLYGAQGLETFRRRFKPHVWENVYLAVASREPDSMAWGKALLALGSAFRPQLRLSLSWIWDQIAAPFRRYPVSSTTVTISTLSFALVNRFGDIPDQVLKDWGYSSSATLFHRLYTTVASDFLFFNFWHYFSSVLLMGFAIRWAERSYPPRFVALFVAAGVFLDDMVNQLMIVTPFRLLHHRIADALTTSLDIGPSLWISLVLGLTLCQLRKYREVAFAALSFAVVLGFALSAPRLYVLVINLNHFLFFVLGFIAGKVRFEYERAESRRVCRQKPPEAKCVLPKEPKRSAQAQAEGDERRVAGEDRRQQSRRKAT